MIFPSREIKSIHNSPAISPSLQGNDQVRCNVVLLNVGQSLSHCKQDIGPPNLDISHRLYKLQKYPAWNGSLHGESALSGFAALRRISSGDFVNQLKCCNM